MNKRIIEKAFKDFIETLKEDSRDTVKHENGIIGFYSSYNFVAFTNLEKYKFPLYVHEINLIILN